MSEKAKTQENSTFKEYIYPVVILTVIALVTTLLLAITNNVTTGVIAAKALAAANATRQELLPDADSFTQATLSGSFSSSDGKANVTEYWTADNGSGAVATVVTSSFGGDLTMMVGISSDGSISGVSVTSSSDTPGVGSKDADPDYLAQYNGLTSLKSENVKGGDVQYISGASVSGQAIHDGVYAALQAFASMGGGQ
jgi:electron transport complex protein RnfG